MPHIKRLGWKLAAFLLLTFTGAAFYLGYKAGLLGTISLTAVPAGVAVISSPGPDCRVAILRSEYTAKFLEKPSNYNDHV
jgi:hypothetical protein